MCGLPKYKFEDTCKKEETSSYKAKYKLIAKIFDRQIRMSFKVILTKCWDSSRTTIFSSITGSCVRIFKSLFTQRTEGDAGMSCRGCRGNSRKNLDSLLLTISGRDVS